MILDSSQQVETAFIAVCLVMRDCSVLKLLLEMYGIPIRWLLSQSAGKSLFDTLHARYAS